VEETCSNLVAIDTLQWIQMLMMLLLMMTLLLMTISYYILVVPWKSFAVLSR
jgi:hypothetical protein